LIASFTIRFCISSGKTLATTAKSAVTTKRNCSHLFWEIIQDRNGFLMTKEGSVDMTAGSFSVKLKFFRICIKTTEIFK
jgi:hypothetical protein